VSTFSIAFAVWQTGAHWANARSETDVTPALYLPTVAGLFVTGTIAASLGLAQWGQLAFGAGMFSWIAIESVLLQRLYSAKPLTPLQRPSLGIQFAPPAVAGVSYLAVSGGTLSLLAYALVGYGVLQLAIVVRLLGWIRHHPLGSSSWAFTFGASSLAAMLLRMDELGDAEIAPVLAPITFVIANLAVIAALWATSGGRQRRGSSEGSSQETRKESASSFSRLHEGPVQPDRRGSV
jgi:tellurite resistance protein